MAGQRADVSVSGRAPEGGGAVQVKIRVSVEAEPGARCIQ
jgi:hypothetical protein